MSALLCRHDERFAVYAAPLLCAAALFSVLKRFASHDVRDDPRYLVFYMVMGAAWVGVFQTFFTLTGVSARDDVVERRNNAAGYALCGVVVGLTFCFAGANIGDGPGWWVVVFCALLSTGAWFALWFVLAKWTDCVDALTLDRDRATGLRLAGWSIGSGIVLGRAVAGDWVSAQATLADFAAVGWPALVLTAVAIVLERVWQPTRDEPLPAPFTQGAMPAVAYVVAAILYVVVGGMW